MLHLVKSSKKWDWNSDIFSLKKKTKKIHYQQTVLQEMLKEITRAEIKSYYIKPENSGEKNEELWII